jgi:hypothetical protein
LSFYIKKKKKKKKRPFGSVVAGEVHPQPHVISFGKGKK